MARCRQRFSEMVGRHKLDLTILAAYILIGAIFTLPLPFTMDRCLAGDNVDVWINPWANWWTQKALSERLPFYYTKDLFYPQGTSLVYHSFSHANTALWLPLRHLVGDLSAYNLTVLATYPLSAFALYLLAHHLTKSRLAAFIAGFIFGFSPYHVAESAHPVLGTIQWIPLFMLSLEKAITQGKVRAGLSAALWLWLTALSGWHLMTLALSLGTCRALYLLLTERRWKSRKVLTALLVASLAFAVMILPFIWPLLREQIVSGTPGYVLANRISFAGTDLLAFFTPSNYHPLFRSFVDTLYEQFYPDRWKKPAFIGYSVMLLGCVGILRSGRKGRFWWIASLVLFVLSLGPRPRVLGKPLLSHPLPWGTALVQLIRHAQRVNILLTLCWSLLAAWGCAALLRAIRRPRSQHRARPIAAAILALIAFEYCPVPFPSTCVEVPRFYTELAQEPGDFAVLEVPMGRGPTKISMYYQTIHGRPLVDGVVSRTPPDAYSFIEANPLLSLLQRYSLPEYEGPYSFPFEDVSRQLGTLADAGIRYVVLHRDRTSPELLAAWQSFAVADPVYDDASLVVYRTHPVAGEDYRVAAHLTEEVGLVKTDSPLPSAVSQGAWLRFDVHWAALGSPTRDYDYRITLKGAMGEVLAAYDVPLAPQWPTSQWPAGTLYTSHFAGQIDPFLRAGLHEITIQVVDPAAAQAVGTPAKLGLVEVQALSRQYTYPQGISEVGAIFGEQIRLIGYHADRTAGSLNVTLYWQALRRMERDYKVFVHLFPVGDEDTIAAQHDGMPRRWTYPTSWWDADEIVADAVQIDVSELSPGRYQASVGLYKPDTQERIPVVDRSGASSPERRLVLPVVFDITG